MVVLVTEVLEVWVKGVWRRVVVLVGEVLEVWAKGVVWFSHFPPTMPHDQ